MSFKFAPHWAIKSASQLALASCWDKLAAGRRFPAFTELKLEPGIHDPGQLVAWNVEGEGRLQKFRALYQGENVADAFNSAWAGKTMEQVVPMSLRRITLDAADECASQRLHCLFDLFHDRRERHAGRLSIGCCCRSDATAQRSSKCSPRCS